MTDLQTEGSAAGRPAGDGSVVPEGVAPPRQTARGLLVLGALGVVYGDIGTSPLYAMQTVFSADGGAVHPDPTAVFGVVSLIFWSILLIASVKYVLFILRADNGGEGGVIALAALARRGLVERGRGGTALVLILGAAGASLFYGDGVITPAISVLSAVEGLKVTSPGLADFVVPIAVVILVGLFSVQHFGTGRVGALFGPVMAAWFGVLAVTGISQVGAHPSILRGLSPTYALAFVADRPAIAFIALGSVVLAITGVEALYADLGHFGRRPIRLAWFFVVFPALTLNYLAQGALLLRRPGATANPFFLLLPHWAQLPMVVLATAATVIASQAVISGAFSMSRQAVRLGFLPHLRVRHTSAKEIGQVYLPAVNAGLFVGTLLVVVAFRSSAKLASAYGVAVTGTFIITTALFLVLARTQWRWSRAKVVGFAAAFGGLEVAFFAANLTKVAHGGWLTLLIAAVLFTVMTTWRRGRNVVTDRRTAAEGSLTDFLGELQDDDVLRVPGVAVFAHPSRDTTPLALRGNVHHNRVLHEHTVIVSGQTSDVPHVPWEQRISVTDLGTAKVRVVHVEATFGFQDSNDFPEVVRRAGRQAQLPPDEVDDASYFLSRITLHREKDHTMYSWRKRLFIVLAHNAASQADSLHLPADRTIVMSSEVTV